MTAKKKHGPNASQLYIQRMRQETFKVQPLAPIKPLVLDRAMQIAIERAADPYKRMPGDGR